jgi:hypothetical protein
VASSSSAVSGAMAHVSIPACHVHEWLTGHVSCGFPMGLLPVGTQTVSDRRLSVGTGGLHADRTRLSFWRGRYRPMVGTFAGTQL